MYLRCWDSWVTRGFAGGEVEKERKEHLGGGEEGNSGWWDSGSSKIIINMEKRCFIFLTIIELVTAVQANFSKTCGKKDFFYQLSFFPDLMAPNNSISKNTQGFPGVTTTNLARLGQPKLSSSHLI
jgi:hypothetical protein